jgi:hypothetical protein
LHKHPLKLVLLLGPAGQIDRSVTCSRPKGVVRNWLDRRQLGWRRHLAHGDCSDYKCSHSIAISAEQWPDHVRLSDLEPRFVCKACGKRGADVRPDFNWDKKPVAMMGFR